MTGARIGNWILGVELGRGSLGVTYRATAANDPSRHAAVKILGHELARSPEFLKKFPGEMLALQRLKHPNIAKFYDAGVHAGQAYYSSEFVGGVDLEVALRTAKKPDDPGLNWREVVLSVAVQAARALKHGHHRSILHRGLKPANCILTPEGVLKVTDFGVGKLFPLNPLTLVAEPFGTVAFLAPEFFTGKPLTRRSDLYTLGGLLYTLLCGRPPFAAATSAEFMHKHCYVLPDRPIQFVNKLPHDCDELVCVLLSKDPSRRPPTAATVIEFLQHIRGKAERKGDKVTWPSGDGTDTMPALPTESAADTTVTWERPRPLMSRPKVVIPLFCALLAVAMLLWFWPRPNAGELYASAQPLLESDNPADWDKAWDDYLEPLSTKYPGEYAEEVRAAKAKLSDRRKLRRAIDDGAKVQFSGDGERLYARGLAFAQVGDGEEAERTWKAIPSKSGDERWWKLAQIGLAELAERKKSREKRP